MSEWDPGQRVDLNNCDREPIHLLGAIQPIGFLVALTSDWIVARVSSNIAQFLETCSDDCIGRPVTELFSGEAVHSLRNRLALLRGANGGERVFHLQLTEGGPRFDVALHMSGSYVIIEAEPSRERDFGDVTGTVRGMVSRLDQARDDASFFGEGARQVRALTGFDRVMIYRFDSDGSGEVVAESARSGIGSFLGLHYPASDIPRQARELYKRSLLRVITDVDAEPVPVVPPTDEHGKPIDLSLSILRSVSPIHIEYLKNMGVKASMSISIIVDGELWGLVACHHYAPRCPAFERRSVAELFAELFATRIESRERRQVADYERRAREVADRLLGAVATDESLLRDPDWLATMLTDVIPADGVGVWINGNYAFSGQTPDTASFARIVRALNVTAAGRVFATDHIAELVPEAAAHAGIAAGLLAIPISRTPRDYVVLFRAERVRSVRWAGDPKKPAEYGPNGPRLTPRQSFEEWKELVEGQSQPFLPSERMVAETLRATLIEVVLRLTDEASVERKAAGERQELLIAELNHRVRNILSLIRGLIRQSRPPEGTPVEDFVRQVDGRIHALARAHNQITDDHWGPAPLQSLIDAETAAFLAHQKDRVTTDGPPVLLNPQAYSTLALVIHELVTNSAKYGGLSDSGRVHISWHRDNHGRLVIDWQESGGPPVTPPTRKGFGTTIIENSVPYDLGGQASIDYAPTGFKASFVVPAKHIGTQDRAVPAAPPPADVVPDQAEGPADRPLEGMQVQLVEDSLIIALDAEDLLRRLGAAMVRTDASVEGAIASIDSQRPDVAVLDINLGDHDSFAIADRLDDLGVPFVFATGYGEQATIPARHRSRMVLQKPYTLATMGRRLPQILAAADPA